MRRGVNLELKRLRSVCLHALSATSSSMVSCSRCVRLQHIVFESGCQRNRFVMSQIPRSLGQTSTTIFCGCFHTRMRIGVRCHLISRLGRSRQRNLQTKNKWKLSVIPSWCQLTLLQFGLQTHNVLSGLSHGSFNIFLGIVWVGNFIRECDTTYG